ncbi:MAG: ABC transporter ATP-binding protein [Geminicoccaceae bacterium]|nr:ABC transporter ATP-binding protein [Geminicoccaceae bacterium]
MTDALLEVRGLRTVFATRHGDLVAVDGVDFAVNAGECVGVVGESGSGKSVTFQSVMGLVRPPGRIDRGSVRLEGRELVGLDDRAWRRIRGRQMAMTLQDALTSLNPAFTIGEQIAETLGAHGMALGRRATRERSLELLRLVGIPAPETRLRDYPHQFSGGMRQRIMIAIALACEPKLLIADEPTTALDVTIQAQVLELLDRLRRELGMAVVIITHDLGVVAEYCDRVMVMYAGQIVERAATRELIDQPLHPYAVGLLASIPDLDHLDKAISPIPGQPPDLARLPAGCRFAPRCMQAHGRCMQPVMLEDRAPGRAVRCVLGSSS